MSDDRALQLTLTQEADYAFRIQFDGTGLDDLLSDEPPPLGAAVPISFCALLARTAASS